MGIKNIDGVKCEEIKMLMKHDNNKNLNPLSRKALEASGGGLNRKKINDLAVYNIEQSIAPQKQIRLTALDKMRIVGRAYLPNMLSWSDSERTQSTHNYNNERFRMINFLSRSVNGLLCKPSVGCLLLPKSLISSKMASRIHYDISRKNYKLTVILRSEASSGSYQLLNNTPNWSDSEHTQSLQTCNDERFRMTNFLSRSVNSYGVSRVRLCRCG